MAVKDKVIIRLTSTQREQLGKMLRIGKHSASLRKRAQILLHSDADGSDAWTDEEIAEHLDVAVNTVAIVRRKFATTGLDATLQRKRPTGRQYRKLDGKQEAQLVTLACTPAPAGHARWTLQLLADQLVVLKVVESIHPSTVYRTLKKTNLSRGFSNSGSSRRKRMPHS